MDGLHLYGALASAALRGQMQYRVSFLLETFAVFLGTGIDFVTLLVLFGRVETIGGWTMPEVALLYGLVSVSLGLAQAVGSGFEDFDEMVRRGQFDQVLIRPRGTFVQVLASQVPLRRMGRIAQGLLALGLALYWLDLDWGVGAWLFAAVTLLAGALFFLGLFLFRAALCFVTVESQEATNILTYGGQEMASYPMHIYGTWFRRVFVYLVPLAFVNYFPALVLLGKDNPLGGPPFAPFLAAPACALVFAAGLVAWGAGVRRYQSTGT